MKRDAKTWYGMADYAERKANEAAASNEPWAPRNLRLWQNKMSEWLGNALKAERDR